MQHDVAVRPMTAADVPDAARVGAVAIDEMAPGGAGEYGGARRAWVEARAAHVLGTDPDGSWVAVAGDEAAGGEVVGVALATVRGDLWFLSLLATRRDLQGTGVGRRLLDAALTTSSACPRAAILASSHPGALRRYAAAGFALEPAFQAQGRLRPPGPLADGVRETSVEQARGLLDAVDAVVRRAPRGRDWELVAAAPGRRVLVVDDPDGERGHALLRDDTVDVVAGTSEGVARRLMASALGTLVSRDGDAERIHSLTARHGWAHEVCLAAGLALRPGPTVCRRGAFEPDGSYVPSGSLG